MKMIMTTEELMNMTLSELQDATLRTADEKVARIQSYQEPDGFFEIKASNYTGLYVVERICPDITREWGVVAYTLGEAMEIVQQNLL
jgi:hypothetical protein